MKLIRLLPEIQEHSFYLMQWLRIGGTNHLIYLDRGANAHLVQGKMPGAGGEYHEILCIGMDSVSLKFKKYDLS